MVHTFISVFYSNTVGRKMSVVSEMPLCCFCTIKRKPKERKKERKSSQVSKYLFRSEITLDFVFVPF
jgi:hypothetical protein